MCLAVPGQIVSIDESDPVVRNARVSFGGVVRDISLAMVPEAQVGQYVIAHAGLALNLVDEEEAQQIFSDLEEIADIEAAQAEAGAP